MSVKSDLALIDSPSALKTAAKSIKESHWIAFDLEADSLHSYPERVCLIQIGSQSGQYLIDTITLKDLEPLISAIKSKELIIHGCDYDLKLLAKQFEFTPKKIFDTKEAARLIGMRQFGLAALTKEYLGVELEKSGQKANWSQRPLKPALIEYAQKDVLYLHELFNILGEKLKALGRYHWQEQTCERLIKIFSKVDQPDPDLVWRIKGAQKLNRLGLAVLKNIWSWREEEALRLNRPPFFVLPHKKVIEIAEGASNRDNYQQLIPKRFPANRKSSLAAVVQEAVQSSVSSRPKRISNSRKRNNAPSVDKVHTFEELRNHRDKLAEELDLDPTVIASRSDLEIIASNWAEGSQKVMPWQWELLSKLGPSRKS